MTIEDILNDARSVVKKVVPDHVEITQVDFEGPTIVIYTKNMEVFAESNELVRQIAQQLRHVLGVDRRLRRIGDLDGPVQSLAAQGALQCAHDRLGHRAHIGARLARPPLDADPHARQLAIDMPAHDISKILQFRRDLAFALVAQPLRVGREHGQRCLQPVSEVGGVGAGAGDGLLLRLQQFIDLADQRRDFLGIAAF